MVALLLDPGLQRRRGPGDGFLRRFLLEMQFDSLRDTFMSLPPTGLSLTLGS